MGKGNESVSFLRFLCGQRSTRFVKAVQTTQAEQTTKNFPLIRVYPCFIRGQKLFLFSLSDHESRAHNDQMERTGLQTSVAGLLGLVACVAVNIWLFRVSMLYGLIGLNVTKHVGVAVLCQAVGINGAGKAGRKAIPRPHSTVNG